MDFHTNCYKQPDIVENLDSPDYTFTLPDITIYSDDFRRFLEKDLIETSTLSSLESTQRLNWWTESGHCRKLWPLSTSGDGNCLLHAASLSLWGFHDRKLTLRTALHGVLSQGEYRDALWRRWRFQQTRLNKEAGFVYSDIEWAREWEDIVSLSSPEPRQSSSAKGVSRRRSVVLDKHNDSFEDNNAAYESLEEIHIFALAHVLRRTIIVVADTVLRDMNGEAMAPIPFGGVYLPFEVAASDCHRAPLLLTYDMAHFSALVSMESIPGDDLPTCIPLVDIHNSLLSIQFCIDPGKDFNWTLYDGAEDNWALSDREHIALLKEYLEVVHVSPIGTPDEELFEDLTDEEFEKRIADIEIVFHDDAAGAIPSNEPTPNGKSKAAKQLQSVAKQFGSIGKSMSKKIKKNIGSIAKIGNNNQTNAAAKTSSCKKTPIMSITSSTQSFNSGRILCAQLKAQRYEYQEEMIRNYLECAQNRFMDAEKSKALRKTSNDASSSGTIAALDNVAAIESVTTCCINAGCQNFGTAATSYMCSDCFEKQRQQEMNSHFDQPPRYGTGNSKFYTQADVNSHQQISRLPSVRRLNELDQTLYLSNSTFYNDKRHHNVDVQPNQNQPMFRGASTVKPTNSYQLSNEANRILDMHRSPEASSYTANPLGRASVYSPGKTIIHNIVRHTVNLPPTNSAGVADMTTIVPRSAYAESPASAMDCVDGLGIAASTPNVPCQTARSCQTIGCHFFGSAATNFYCSKCCKQLDEIATLVNSSQQPRTQSKVLTDV